jgi:adenylyltransferase/sulfurtransferase
MQTVTIKEINVHQLRELMSRNIDFQLVDVREPYETEIASLGGDLIPQNSIPSNLEKLSREKPVIIYCRTGVRSADTVSYLQEMHGFDNVYNLKGGIHAWADEIDPSISKYENH